MIQLRMLVLVILPAVLSALPMVGTFDQLAVATAVTGSLAILLLVGPVHLALEPATAPARVRTIALRVRARHAAFLRLRDPDAPGPRPPPSTFGHPRGRVTHPL